MKKLLITLQIILLLFVSCSKNGEETVSVQETGVIEETQNTDIVAEQVLSVVEETVQPEIVEQVKEFVLPWNSNSSLPDGYEGDFVTICGVKVGWDGSHIIEPDSILDIENMEFADFGSFFEEEYPVTITEYTIAPDEISETTVYHIHSENPGPSVYIAAGIHGDERAAWYAGILMRNATIKCGDLYVLAPANANGAAKGTRYVTLFEDPNRYFPGDPDGNDAEKLDWAIFSDVKEKKPELLLDLHEAIVYSNKKDFLGSTYIFTSMEGMEDLFFDLLFATQEGSICHNEFGFTGPGPDGSMNSTITNILRIPTITVETFRGFDIHRRVYDQLDTIQFILEYKGMR